VLHIVVLTVIAAGATFAVAEANATRPSVVRQAICHYWHPCGFALRVAWCESRWQTYARNGQYLGLFQMGSYARGRYGHSWGVWGQVRAAYRYYREAGWGPWECARMV
jgi:hypothetical protein